MSLWPEISLAECLRPAGESTPVRADGTYPNFGMFSFGRGLFRKAPILGLKSSATSLTRVRRGQFVYSRLFAFEGAYGVVDDEFDDHYVSNEYPVFDIDVSKLLPGFLRLHVSRPSVWAAIAQGSKGVGVRRQRVHPEQVLAHRIPLPPPLEQQRIVARIEELESQSNSAQALQVAVATEADELCRALLRDAGGVAVATPLRQLVIPRVPDVKVQADISYHFAGVYSFGRGVFASNTKAGTEFAYPRLTRLRSSDFVYPKLMAWEGAFGIVPPECDGLVVSTEFPVFEVKRDRVLPQVLDVYFRNPALWASIGGASTGTNVRRRRLNPQDFLNLELPLPPMERQHLLAKAYAGVQEVKARQSQSRAMLQALLPAILDRAFAGAL